eukprot:1957687-Rhodomonas_salina.1
MLVKTCLCVGPCVTLLQVGFKTDYECGTWHVEGARCGSRSTCHDLAFPLLFARCGGVRRGVCATGTADSRPMP